MTLYRLRFPLFVLHPMDVDIFYEEMTNVMFETFSCLCYEEGKSKTLPNMWHLLEDTLSSGQDLHELVEVVNNRDMDIDITIFMGTDHRHLMKILDNRTGIFRFPRTTLIAKPQMGEIALRLDTNVVTVDEFRENIPV